jgi:hypothetical protein
VLHQLVMPRRLGLQPLQAPLRTPFRHSLQLLLLTPSLTQQLLLLLLLMVLVPVSTCCTCWQYISQQVVTQLTQPLP